MNKMKLKDLYHYLTGKVVLYDINDSETNVNEKFKLFDGYFADIPAWLADYNFTIEQFRAKDEAIWIGCVVPVRYTCLSDLENHINPWERKRTDNKSEEIKESNSEDIFNFFMDDEDEED